MVSSQLALILWAGDIGGAELLTANLAVHFRRHGVDASLVFVGNPEPLATRLRESGVPHVTLGFRRGRDLLKHPVRYAREVSKLGPDGALLVDCGFMGAALRAGGYRGTIVGVEHGGQLEGQNLSPVRRLPKEVARLAGAWADDAEVGVSDFMVSQMRKHPRARRVRRIYNGVDKSLLSSAEIPTSPGNNDSHCTRIGFVGRLVSGKGTDHLINAFAQVRARVRAHLIIAGDGPERGRLESLATSLGVNSAVEFVGVIGDVAAFWRRCDIAAIPSHTFESFSMVTLEAMACHKAIVATNSGAIPELVLAGATGTLVAPGDIDALAHALIHYAEHPELRKAHGTAARTRATVFFPFEATAGAYLRLFDELSCQSSW
jgi:glycosyltransferase involved in cell wall biosynthesis